MNNEYSKIKYFIYARKSQEGEEKQVQSIPDQLRENEGTAKRYNIKPVGILTEEGSAKEPNKRPVFDDMLERIKKGEANGIVCWNLNRLSRNPVDSGKLQWMLQQGMLQSILTPTREYKPNDNAIIFSVESGGANQFILDLKVGVNRGLNSKVKKGQAPMLAPLGYLNTKHEARGENYIIKDPDRFDLVRKMWDLMLTGEYTIPKLLKVVNDDWGMLTRKFKHRGGVPVNKSTMYNILTNIFYTGLFVYRGETSNGTHEPMITLAEFDKVQAFLGRYGRPRAKTHAYAFTGTMICGECGSSITACEKTKLIKGTGKLKDYTFYYCSRRKVGAPKCTQRHFIPLAEMEAIIKAEVDKYTISAKFRDKELTEKIVIFKQKVSETQNRAHNWLKYTEEAFDFAHTAKVRFDDPKTTLDEKKSIFMSLGGNYILKDKNLYISQHKYLERIAKKRKAVEEEISRSEPEENADTQRQNTPFGVRCPILRSRRGSNP